MFLEDLELNKRKVSTPITLQRSFIYWQEMLFAKTLSLFEWKGLPPEIPQKEIEMYLMYYGYCGFLNDKKVGLMVSNGSLTGVTQYGDIFTHFVYARPTAMGGSKLIGKYCVLIENNMIRNPIFPLVERYATLISHAEITLKCGLVNMRTNRAFVSDNDVTADNIRAWEKGLVEGNIGTILDKEIQIPSFPQTTNNLMTGNLNSTYLRDIVETRNEILRMFFSEIGVNYSKEKKGNMITDEVNQNDNMLLLNVNSMLKSRQKACDEIRELFGIDVSVDFSQELKKIQESEVEENDD